MTIYYIDPEGGTDPALGTANGRSFLQRITQLNSASSGFSVTAGDEIRIIGSSDPTALGNHSIKRLNLPESYYGKQGTLTQTTTAGTSNYYYQGTNMPNGTPIGHCLETGDTVWFFGWTDAAQRGLNGTWEVTKVDDYNFTIDGYQGSVATTTTSGYWISLTGRRVKLSAAVTKNIACHGTRVDPSNGNFVTWTAINATGVNTTCSLVEAGGVWGASGHVVESYRSDEINTGCNVANQVVAYSNIGTLQTPVDFSAYEQVSLKYRTPSAGGFGPGLWSLRLCTGLAGTSPVHTVDLSCAGSQDKGWMSLTKDFGTALSSSIRSVAIYRDSGSGTSTAARFFLSNIIACKASSANDCLTHNSLVGLNTTDDPDWYPVESINGTRLLLRGHFNNRNGDIFGYYYPGNALAWSATNTNASLYVRKTLRRDLDSSQPGTGMNYNNPVIRLYSVYGSQSNKVKISGGWDTTSMSTQNLEMSYLDGVYMEGYGIQIGYGNHFEIEKVGGVRFNTAFHLQGCYHVSIEDVAAVECNQGMWAQIYSSLPALKIKHCNNCMYQGLYLNQLYFKYYDPSIYTEKQTTYADRDRYKIRAACNQTGAYFIETQTYAPFKYIDTPCNFERGTHIQTCRDFEIESSDVSLGRNYGTGVQMDSARPIMYHSLTANQVAKVFDVLKGEHTVLNVTNTNTWNATGGTENQAGDYPGGWGNAIECRNAGTSLTIGNASTSSDFDGKIQGYTNSQIRLLNTSVSYSYGASISTSGGAVVRLKNAAGYTTRNVYGSSGYIEPDTSNPKTSGGTSWKCHYLNDPVEIHVGKVAVNAGTQASVSVWVYGQSISSSEADQVKLKVDGTNVYLSNSLVTDFSSNFGSYTWKQLTVNFTPVIAGIVDVYLVTGGGSYTVNFDEMSATQV